MAPALPGGDGRDPSHNPYAFSAFPFPPGHFRVREVHGREAMSRPYVFDVTVTTSTLAGEDLERLTLGQRAALLVRVGGPTRVVPGVVSAVRSEGVRLHDSAAQYTLRLVPAMALLRHQKGSRIFQDMRIDEIVDQVLRVGGSTTRWDMTKSYPVRPYVTQYEESDLAFVHRLLAEAGIYYYFATPPAAFDEVFAAAAAIGGPVSDAAALIAAASTSIAYPIETLVFGDDPSTYPAIVDSLASGALNEAAAAGAPTSVSVGPFSVGLAAPKLYYLERHGTSIERHDKVTEFVAVRRVRSDVAEFRDYDPERPGTGLVSRAGERGAAAADVQVDFDVDGGLSSSMGPGTVLEGLAALLAHRTLETYEHHGPFLFPDWKDVEEHAKRIRLARARRRVTADGKSMCTALSAGHRFHLQDHPVAVLDAEHVVFAVEHRGCTAEGRELYENVFSCAPAAAAWLPRRPRPHSVHSLVTATVVGPGASEIHVDSLGRIKVLFHWDRRQVRDDSASCWVRVVQPWAGTAFGQQFVPRVGMEVVVAFEGGDPDRPIVTGALYNATHSPPFPLPAQSTQSGIRTRSVPGGDGFNELSFEDAAAKERIFVHAQRDLDAIVRRNRTTTVQGDDILRVTGAKRDELAGSVTAQISGDHEEVVAKTATCDHGARVDIVQRTLDQRVGGARTVRVEGTDNVDVRGTSEHRFAGDHVTRTTGNFTLVVGKNEAQRSLTLRAEGVASISADRTIELEAKAGLVLKCGKTIVRIGEDGVEIQGAMIRAGGEAGSLEVGKDGLKLTTEKVFAHLDDKLVIKTDKASMSMDQEIKLDGKKILMNSPDQATDEAPPDEPPPTDVELVDQDGKPLPNQRFVIELDDGSQRIGVTDKDGKASLDLPSNGKIRFPDLTEVESA